MNLLGLFVGYFVVGLVTLVVAALEDKSNPCWECHYPVNRKDSEPSLILFFWPVVWGLAVVSLVNELYYYVYSWRFK